MEEYADLEAAKVGYVAGHDRIVYDYHKVISILMKHHNTTQAETIEYLEEHEIMDSCYDDKLPMFVVRAGRGEEQQSDHVLSMFHRLQGRFHLTTEQLIATATYDNEDTWLNGRVINTLEELVSWVHAEFENPADIEVRFDELPAGASPIH